MACREAHRDLPHHSLRPWNGRFHELYTARYAQEVPLRDGEEAVRVQWDALTISKESEGMLLYRNAFGTDHPVNVQTVAGIAQAGRAYWTVENENPNVLKATG